MRKNHPVKKSFLTCLSWNKNKTFPTYLQLPRVYSAAKWIIMSYLVWDASAWHVIVWGASGWHVNLMQGTRLHIYLHHNNHNYNLLHYILHTPAPTSPLPLFYLDPPFGFYLTLLIFFNPLDVFFHPPHQGSYCPFIFLTQCPFINQHLHFLPVTKQEALFNVWIHYIFTAACTMYILPRKV